VTFTWHLLYFHGFNHLSDLSFYIPCMSRRPLPSAASRENRIPVRQDCSSHLEPHPWHVLEQPTTMQVSSSVYLAPEETR